METEKGSEATLAYLHAERKGDLESLLPPSAFLEKTRNFGGSLLPPKVSLKLPLAFIGWYFLNVVYIVENKITLNSINLPWTLSALQLCVGWFFALIFWGTGLRPRPRFKRTSVLLKTVIPQGLCHLFVHSGAVISMGLGAVSFTHVVKAAEPVVTAALSVIILKEFLNVYAYLSLIPIVLGVALSSLKELDFKPLAFWFAMLSNLGSSLRSILAKLTMKGGEEFGKNISAGNIYMLLTLVSSVFSVPLAIFLESGKYKSTWMEATVRMTSYQKRVLVFRAILSGASYYLCNDMSFICLGEINQVSHAVANTVKRVVLISASIIVFNYRITYLGYLGVTIAILGTFLYALFK